LERGETKAAVRNVIGVLRGSDPVLKDTYVFVTAHYDHLGTREREGETDSIFNGANDDASGVAGMIEVARALVAAKPKRSVVFMGFYGEERGLLGSTYYGRNPVFPLKASVAQINLEQIGRTDDDEGPRVGAFNLTGFDYTDISTFLKGAAEKAGVKLEKHEKNNEPYFMRSDNAALARVGVPSTTISTAYSFPDYHRAGDHWDKLDYPNFAKIANAISGGVLTMANSDKAPAWSANNPKVARYIEAQKARGG
jgi:Zn-dependent M28 family amino/carboxypeptidase